MNWADWLSFPGSIAVYGAGYVAETLWIALERCGLSDRVRCFVVTERKDGQSFKHGKQILSLQEYILSRQVLRSGTSIGANVREAQRGQSSPDFYAKMNIALKDADETAYWLELLYEGKYLEEERFTKIYEDCEELIRLLVYILKKNYSK